MRPSKMAVRLKTAPFFRSFPSVNDHFSALYLWYNVIFYVHFWVTLMLNKCWFHSRGITDPSEAFYSLIKTACRQIQNMFSEFCCLWSCTSKDYYAIKCNNVSFKYSVTHIKLLQGSRSKAQIQRMSQDFKKPTLSWIKVCLFTIKPHPCFRAVPCLCVSNHMQWICGSVFPRRSRGWAQIREGDQLIRCSAEAFYCLHIISVSN